MKVLNSVLRRRDSLYNGRESVEIPSFQYVIKEYIKSTYSKIEVEFILTSHSIVGDLVGRKALLRSLSVEPKNYIHVKRESSLRTL